MSVEERLSPKTLGTLLRQRRNERGMTQAQIADSMGWLQSSIAELEAGRRRLDVIEFLAYAEVLRCNPTELLDDVIALRAR